MKELWTQRLAKTGKYLLSVAKWLVLSVLMGAVCGTTGSIFAHCVELVTRLRSAHGWLILLLPAAGLLIALCYHLCHMENDRGTNNVILAIRSETRIPGRLAPLMIFSTCLTHLCGGSAGREGAAIQTGGSLGAFLGRLMHLSREDNRIITMCGMSAVFTALFGTPLTAAVFSMEVASVGIFYYAAFIPCMVSSLISLQISTLFHVAHEQFPLAFTPGFTTGMALRVLILAALCAGISILFCVTMHGTERLYKKYLKSPCLRAAAGGLLVAGLTVLAGSQDYNGAGNEIIVRALEGEALPCAFLVKLIFTALTIGAGFKGGEIVPSFYIGSTFGCTAAHFLGIPGGFGAAIGLISVFCGVVNCPVTALLLSVELFGDHGLLYFALSCAISYGLSGNFSLYSTQKIIYSKVKADWNFEHTDHNA